MRGQRVLAAARRNAATATGRARSHVRVRLTSRCLTSFSLLFLPFSLSRLLLASTPGGITPGCFAFGRRSGRSFPCQEGRRPPLSSPLSERERKPTAFSKGPLEKRLMRPSCGLDRRWEAVRLSRCAAAAARMQFVPQANEFLLRAVYLCPLLFFIFKFSFHSNVKVGGATYVRITCATRMEGSEMI